ncbi:MAG: PQQ-binding-like beta-propeller repeat protein [Planctomycetota bacterium]
MSLHAEDEFDWPGIRGPKWDGHSAETGIADLWPEQGPPVLWTRELGQGYSSFIAWDELIATQYQSLSGQYVICLDALTGRTIWEYRYDWPYDPAGVYPGPRATPTYHRGRLYFASPAGLIGCLDARSGKLLWSLELETTFQCNVTGFGYACSPTVVDDIVILPVGGTGSSMVALDAETGNVRWKAGDDAASYAPAYPISFQGRDLVLGYLENVLVCHDRKTGERLWRHSLSQGYDEHSSWPVYREPWLWISSPFQAGTELLELQNESLQSVRSVNKSRRMSNDIFSSVLVNGAIFGFDVREPQAKTHRSTRGVFRCVDMMTGDELWSAGDDKPIRDNEVPETVGDKGPGHATVIAVDGKLILLNDLGELILASQSTERFEELGRVSVLGGEICWTQPALSRGRLFVRNQSRAACLFLGDPSRLDSQQRNQAITTADIPQQAYFDLASVVLGVEPEYAFDLPSQRWLMNWFRWCLAIMAASLPIAVGLIFTMGWQSLPFKTKSLLYWTLVFTAGCFGTTMLSLRANDFIFTWPVAVFAVYQPFIDRISLSRKNLTRRDKMRSAIAGFVFVTVSFLYFLACRRLSLVFEWVFLVGFVAAVPISLAGRFLWTNRRWTTAWNVLAIIFAFAVFYWSAVLFLHLRVH